LFLSKYEGFGLPIIEAQYFGCPVVCSTLEVFKEVASSSNVIFLEDNSTSLSNTIYLLNDSNFRKDLIFNGKLNSLIFDPKIAAEKYRVVYESFNFLV
jgi:glycosyltransferase involved in cell wall biosynthesis